MSKISSYEYIVADLLAQRKIGFVQQYIADPARPRSTVDFAFPISKMVLEVEGGIGGKFGGRHTSFKGFTTDCEKYNRLSMQGWTVYRAPSHWIKGTTKKNNPTYTTTDGYHWESTDKSFDVLLDYLEKNWDNKKACVARPKG